ncbi:hypothetical protein V0U79_08955 [Hyphobacterium sp. HN65]|uniref:ATP-binding protein n=1 Tax=Hyphobacterium lacteum TaxID=3116575 RepID=A0ABU7LRG1_9PROT|nr:hypothetical protein [Hyphobacterium sp. HN65]MEE2526493.1 hypothetical protein [Hyphobacterium sp. HN65]
MKLDIQSEAFPPTGAFSGDGATKLLGTPRNDPFQTVLREAVQNCWDARRDDVKASGLGIDIHVRLRTLDGNALRRVLNVVLSELPPPESGASFSNLTAATEADSLRILEISDFGTDGLAGPTRSDQPRRQGQKSDFVDFFRDIGAPQDKAQGGGTYGYGKSSLYHASRCRTIFVDSLTTHNDQKVRRLMGCHIGGSYSVLEGDSPGRFTGRHWWGRMAENVIEPAEGQEATAIADLLECLPRPGEEFGTSILILDPDLPGNPDDGTLDLGRTIREVLLWNFWPKLIPKQDDTRAITFHCEVDGEKIEIPDPSECPPFDTFVTALTSIRSGNGKPVMTTGRAPVRVGYIATHRKLAEPRSPLLCGVENSIVPNQLVHIAVMRPVELVVRYFVFDSGRADGVDSAGVFVSDTDDAIESAFARAEPPAHDDWVVDSLPKRSLPKKYVQRALAAVREEGMAWGAPSLRPSAGEGDVVDGAAKRLGRFLPTESGPDHRRASVQRTSKAGVEERQKSAIPIGLREDARSGAISAEFSVEVSSVSPQEPVTVKAVPLVVREGRPDRSASGKTLPNGGKVDVIAWMDAAGNVVSKGAIAKLSKSGTYTFNVTLPEPVAIAVDLEWRR